MQVIAMRALDGNSRHDITRHEHVIGSWVPNVSVLGLAAFGTFYVCVNLTEVTASVSPFGVGAHIWDSG
jgi:hypothetical protein